MASSPILVSSGNIAFLASVILLYALIATLQKWKPEKLERKGVKLEGLIIMYRTERLNRAIISIARRRPRLLRLFGDLSAVAGLILMFYGLAYFHQNLINFWRQPEMASPVAPVIPGITLSLDALPYFLVAVFLTILPHELAHALTAVAEDVPLKSTGLFLALVFPGGFAEIDEERLGKASLRTKLHVLSSGSFTNIASFFVFALLAILLIHPIGVRIASTLPGYPAATTLKAGDIILAVDGVSTQSLDDFQRVLASKKPGESVELKVQRGGEVLNLTLKLAPRPDNTSRGFLGVQIQQAVSSYELYNLLFWCMVLSSSVAIINMLPILPLDGGRVFQALIEKIMSPEGAKRVTMAITAYTAIIILLNIVFSTNIYGFVPFP
ncbi:MAG: site-2 protease family protein [Infirmifilum sp.]